MLHIKHEKADRNTTKIQVPSSDEGSEFSSWTASVSELFEIIRLCEVFESSIVSCILVKRASLVGVLVINSVSTRMKHYRRHNNSLGSCKPQIFV